jgi:hypothetical protein
MRPGDERVCGLAHRQSIQQLKWREREGSLTIGRGFGQGVADALISVLDLIALPQDFQPLAGKRGPRAVTQQPFEGCPIIRCNQHSSVPRWMK